MEMRDEEGSLAAKDLPDLPASLQLAQEVGAGLGDCRVLLRTLPTQQGRTRAWNLERVEEPFGGCAMRRLGFLGHFTPRPVDRSQAWIAAENASVAVHKVPVQ